MIKNIMENIGRKEAAENYGKLIDRREELFAKKERREKLSPEEVDELKDLTEKIQHYLFSMLGKKKENPAEVEEKEEVKEDVDTDEFDSAGKKRPSTDVAYLKGSEDPQLKADVIKAIKKHNATGNNLLNVLYNKGVLRKETEAEELYNKLDKMGTTNAEQFINQLAYDPEYDSEEK